ncbi:MAG TPA: hypothetical protein VMH23_18220 [Bacteroidota bacterium]|nr:hypothetical protein [Bacteroidota bacterium]
MERSTHNRINSKFALLVGLVTAVAATVAVMAFAKHDGTVSAGFSDDWDEIIGM